MKKNVLIFAVGTVFASGMAMAADAVNVNTAQSVAIAKALGVGENIGARVIAEREENGPFKSTDELGRRVRGLNQKEVDKHKANIKL